MPSAGQYTIPVTASIAREEDKWIWTVSPGHDGDPDVIESQGVDLVKAASREMYKGLCAFVPNVELWHGLSPEARQGHSDALKVLGRKLTEVLFDGRQDEFVAQLARMASPVIEQITYGKNEQPLFEYCLLKDGETEFYLGERCLCIYSMVRKERRGIRQHYAASRRVGPRLVGYAEDGSLGSACKQHNAPDPSRPEEQIAVAVALAEGGGSLSVLEPLTEALLDDELEKFRNWIAEPRHVVHFNCSGKQRSDDPKLLLRAGALVGIEEMTRPAPADFRGSFIFLNAWSSAVGRDSIRTSFAEFFRQKRAACVLCTTGPIEDGFATRLAKAFYNHLQRDGMNALNALLAARQSLLQEGHPMALQYTYVGDYDYRLA